jgi:hypothetical protein
MHVVDYLSRRPHGDGLCGVWETAGPLLDIQTLASERSSESRVLFWLSYSSLFFSLASSQHPSPECSIPMLSER